jgi:uncharacterized membrane protein YphA (DoxX/SURF4 family)
MARTLTLWTLVFLVVLRLAIGWQFLTEGLQKVRSTTIGPTETNKPFSSEGYFRGSTGPFSALIRSQITDPDEQLHNFVTLVPLPKDRPPSETPPEERMPPALASAWGGYYESFLSVYPLDGMQRDRAKTALQQAKIAYVGWLQGTGLQGSKEAERTISGNKVKMNLSTPVRIAEYEKALADHREYDSKRWRFFQDVDRDGQALTRAKLIELRTALRKDVDEQSDEMRKALGDIVRQKIDDALHLPTEEHELEGELLQLLTVSPAPGTSSSLEFPLAAYMPHALDERWKSYLDALQTNLKVADPKQQELGKRLLDRSRDQTVRWLLDLEVQNPRAASLTGLVAGGDPLAPLLLASTAVTHSVKNPGPPDRLAQFRLEKQNVDALRKLETAAVDSVAFVPSEKLKKAEENLEKSTKSLHADIVARNKEMKSGLEEMLTDTQKKVAPPRTPEGWTFLKILDLVTICVITLAGLLLMLGLFTRLACILAAGFLLLTFLSAPPLPWLPLAPATEGNPIYINKNLIEFFALLALAGTASGRWFGIDALLARIFGKPDPEPEPEPTTSTPAA